MNLPFFPPLILHLGISIPACRPVGTAVWIAVVGAGGFGAIGFGRMGLFRFAPEVDGVPWLVRVVDEPDEVLAVRRPDELELFPTAGRPPRRGPEPEPDEWLPLLDVTDVVEAGEMALSGELAAGVAAADVETGDEGVEVNGLILAR